MPRRTFFELHIRPMIREMDRMQMLNNGFDLWDVAVVKENASTIQNVLANKHLGSVMPPVAYGGPWPEEWLQLFNRWVGEGCPTLDLGEATYSAQRTGDLVTVTAAVKKPGTNFAAWPDRYFGPPQTGGVTPDLVLYQEPLDGPPPPPIAAEGVGYFTFPAAQVSLTLLDKNGIQTIPITPAGP